MSDGDEVPDEFPELWAALERVLENAADMARIARGFYDAYKGQDFTDAQAIYLTVCGMYQGPGAPPS